MRESEGAVLSFDVRQVQELTERYADQALEKLRESTGNSCPPIIVEREGNRFVIELPGMKTSEAPRIKLLIERL